MTELQEERKEVDPSIKANETARRVITRLWFLIGATLLLYLVMGGLALKIYSVARTNTDAMCTVRADSEKRIAQTEQFIKKHPKGFSGISVADLRRGNETSEATVRALSKIDCPAPPPVVRTSEESQ